MKLYSRQVKGDFFSDVNLLKSFTAEERFMLLGLLMIAEDSGCLEDNMAVLKALVFPLDSQLSESRLNSIRNKYIEAGELVRYKVEERHCLYIKNFREWTNIPQPRKSSFPLPVWIKWRQQRNNSNRGRYIVNDLLIGAEESAKDDATWKMFDIREEVERFEPRPLPATKTNYTPEFEDFWLTYPRKIEKKRAFKVWEARLKEGYKAEDLINAAFNYESLCKMMKTAPKYVKHPATFIGPSCAFEEFIEGIPEHMRAAAAKEGRKNTKSNVEKGLELVKLFEDQQ